MAEGIALPFGMTEDEMRVAAGEWADRLARTPAAAFQALIDSFGEDRAHEFVHGFMVSEAETKMVTLEQQQKDLSTKYGVPLPATAAIEKPLPGGETK